jgi:hypothetical protein
MPRYATELTQGQAFSRTSEENGVNDTAQRVFKIALVSPAEVFNPQVYTGVYIGTIHPYNNNLICFSFDSKFDGDSRMVTLVTFNYKSFASSPASSGRPEPKTIQPEIRPANWYTDTSLMEIPAPTWNEFGTGKWVVPVNPVGDRYEGVRKMVPVTSIRVDQYESADPLNNMDQVGKINSKTIKVGSHNFALHTLMLRGISSRPHVETFQGNTFRGWIASYELVYKANIVFVSDPEGGEGDPQRIVLGWDHLQVVEGTSVKNLAGAVARADVDPFGLALTHNGQKVQFPLTLADGTENKKVRAMMAIPSYDDRGGWVQRPVAAPIALNLDGTPRDLIGGLNPLVVRYQVQESGDLVADLNLRLY